jgi:hypothetical protein
MMNASSNNIDRLIETCLNMIQYERIDIETVLSRYPDHADELRPVLEAALWIQEQRDKFDPRPGVMRASKARVLNQIRQEQAARSLPADEPAERGFFWGLPWLDQKMHTLRTAFTILLIAFLVVSTSSVALASAGAIPGDSLYPLKLGLEEAALAVTPSEAGDAQLRIDFAQRRLREIQMLTLEGRYDYIPSAVQNFEAQVQDAVKTLSTVASNDPKQAEMLAQSLQNTLADQTEMIIILSNVVPQHTRSELKRVEEVSESGQDAARRVLRAAERADSLPPTPTSQSGGFSFSTPLPTSTLRLPTGPAAGGRTTPVPTRTDEPTSTPPLASYPMRPTSTLRPFIPTPLSTPTSAPLLPTEPFGPPTLTPRIPTNTPRPTETPTDTPVPTATDTPTPTSTLTDTPSATPTDTATPTPTLTPSETPSVTPSGTPSATPSGSQSPDTPVPTRTDTPTQDVQDPTVPDTVVDETVTPEPETPEPESTPSP